MKRKDLNFSQWADELVASDMALWKLLVFLYFIAPVASSLAVARYAKLVLSGYALAIVAGLIVGVCCAWAAWVAHKFAVTRIRRRSPGRQVWYFRALYVSNIFGVAVAALLGEWVQSRLLALVLPSK